MTEPLSSTRKPPARAWSPPDWAALPVPESLRDLPPLAEPAARLRASRIVELWELGFGRDDVIGLWVGEGDIPTPAFISEAAYRALRDGHCFYSAKRGLPVLREALADYHARHYGVRPAVERVTLTSSGMNAIMLIMQAILRPGANLVCVTPAWPNLMAAAQIVGAEVRCVELEPSGDGGFALDLARVEAACDADTAAVCVISPSNPVGWTIERDQQQALLELCRARNIWLLADEVYHRFTFDRPVAPSFLEIAEADDPLFVVNSFSKAWCMTGWRLGWMLHPARLGELFGNLIEMNTSGPQAFLEYGALAALEEGEDFVRDNIERCRTGGELVYQRLAALPRVSIARPRASFYSFFRVEGVDDSLAFAKRLLAETGVGLAPGSAFGPGGEGHLRLCFATSAARLSAAMDRLVPALS